MVDTIPQVMFTFFKKHANDLNGKTAIPFTTHEGLGLANCVVDVKAAFPRVNVTKGFSIYSHEVLTEKNKPLPQKVIVGGVFELVVNYI